MIFCGIDIRRYDSADEMLTGHNVLMKKYMMLAHDVERNGEIYGRKNIFGEMR